MSSRSLFRIGMRLVGLYLLFGARALVNGLEPSNCPHCDACGYELTGLPPDGACPECGTPYRAASV